MFVPYPKTEISSFSVLKAQRIKNNSRAYKGGKAARLLFEIQYNFRGVMLVVIIDFFSRSTDFFTVEANQYGNVSQRNTASDLQFVDNRF